MAARTHGLTRRKGALPEGMMPTLFRLVVALAILGAMGAAAMTALAVLVKPTPREIVTTIPLPPQGR